MRCLHRRDVKIFLIPRSQWVVILCRCLLLKFTSSWELWLMIGRLRKLLVHVLLMNDGNLFVLTTVPRAFVSYVPRSGLKVILVLTRSISMLFRSLWRCFNLMMIMYLFTMKTLLTIRSSSSLYQWQQSQGFLHRSQCVCNAVYKASLSISWRIPAALTLLLARSWPSYLVFNQIILP